MFYTFVSAELRLKLSKSALILLKRCFCIANTFIMIPLIPACLFKLIILNNAAKPAKKSTSNEAEQAP